MSRHLIDYGNNFLNLNYVPDTKFIRSCKIWAIEYIKHIWCPQYKNAEVQTCNTLLSPTYTLTYTPSIPYWVEGVLNRLGYSKNRVCARRQNVNITVTISHRRSCKVSSINLKILNMKMINLFDGGGGCCEVTVAAPLEAAAVVGRPEEVIDPEQFDTKLVETTVLPGFGRKL